MPRPPIARRVAGVPPVTLFKPAGVPGCDLEVVPLTVDEIEAMRLIDYEGLSHEQAASLMGVSRQTAGRIVETARRKVTEALVFGKAVEIGGGAYRLETRLWRCRACGARWTVEEGSPPAEVCPRCGSSEIGPCWGPRCAGRRGGRGWAGDTDTQAGPSGPGPGHGHGGPGGRGGPGRWGRAGGPGGCGGRAGGAGGK